MDRVSREEQIDRAVAAIRRRGRLAAPVYRAGAEKRYAIKSVEASGGLGNVV
jgi:hypothetical protein